MTRAFFEMDLQGLDELEKKLNELPIRIRNRGLRQALNAGTDIIQTEAMRLAPKGSPEAGWESFVGSEFKLADNISKRVSVSKTRSWGRVGIDWTKIRYGHLVEFGHRIVLKRRDTGRRSKKIPFMRPAYDSKGDQAVDKMANILYDVIFGGY